jgi:3-oxoacyl-(acyl-carrier-protein) synthase
LHLQKDDRKLAPFMKYAILAADEALDDAGWRPETDAEKDMTVIDRISYSIMYLWEIGGGLGCVHWLWNRMSRRHYKQFGNLFTAGALMNCL